MIERTTEPIINDRISQLLSSGFGIDCRAERTIGGKRPDIRCFYRGLAIAIETSFDRRDAEEDAKRRIDEDFADIAIALYLGRRENFKDLTEKELDEKIRNSKFEAKIFSQHDTQGLLRFITSKLRTTGRAGDWLEVDLPGLHSVITHSIDYLVKKDVELRKVEGAIDNFVHRLRTLDHNGNISKRIYEVLYKLYGLSPQEDPEIAFGHAGLSILLSTVFYEHVRAVHVLPSIDSHGRSIEGLKKALSELLKHDYKTALRAALEILDALPPEANNSVRDLINLGVELAQKRALLRRDFAGKIYHRITGNIAVRKGFATFFTEAPSAYLLAHLAVLSLFGLDERNITRLSEKEAEEIVERIKGIKVGDFACGSGTLLTAAYYALIHSLASALRFYHGIDVDLDELGKAVIEEGIYGIDALRYASQITAINLALIGPPGRIAKENIYTIYLGYIKEKNMNWLGSLELLNNGRRVGGILAYIEGGLRGAVDRVSLEGSEGEFSIPDKFDLVIMNPPFTRATGRTEAFGEGRGLFGFAPEERVRRGLIKRLEEIRSKVRDDLVQIAQKNIGLFPPEVKKILNEGELDQYLNIGQAGEGLLFLYLAYKYVKNGGVIAFVLPRNLLSGVSWFLARVLLATKFHVKYIVISSEPGNHNFSESTSLSEVLIVAKRTDSHSDNEETTIVNLTKKPGTTLEATLLAHEILRQRVGIAKIGEASAVVWRINRRELLKHVVNWGVLLDASLHKQINELLSGSLNIGNVNIKVPLTQFGELIKDMGVNRGGDIIEAFKLKVRGNRVACDEYSKRASSTIPMVCGGGEDISRHMLIEPNAYVPDLNNPKAMRIKNLRSKLLVPDRIWWYTFHTTAIMATEEVIANRYFMAKTDLSDEQIRALVAWLNSLWGLMTIYANMEVTRSLFTRINIAQWKLLPVLDVKKLDPKMLKCLSEVFGNYAKKDLGVLSEESEERIALSAEIAKCLSGTHTQLNEGELKRKLKDVQKQLVNALAATQ